VIAHEVDEGLIGDEGPPPLLASPSPRGSVCGMSVTLDDAEPAAAR
jgi:hypothetical protein